MSSLRRVRVLLLPCLLLQAVLSAQVEAKRQPAARAQVVEHDDTSLFGTTRHILRATVKEGLSPEQLRRCIDRVLDEERLIHPQVDSVGVYLYEVGTYAKFTGRATPLAAAIASGIWAPAGSLQNPARSLSKLDNQTVYTLPQRTQPSASPSEVP